MTRSPDGPALNLRDARYEDRRVSLAPMHCLVIPPASASGMADGGREMILAVLRDDDFDIPATRSTVIGDFGVTIDITRPTG